MRKMTTKGFLKSEFLIILETLEDEIWRKLESFNKAEKEEDVWLPLRMSEWCMLSLDGNL